MSHDGKVFALTIELVRDDAVLSQLIVQRPPPLPLPEPEEPEHRLTLTNGGDPGVADRA